MKRVALITGGNRGIGFGISKRMLQAGYQVQILATRPEPTDVLNELREFGEVGYTQGSIAELDDHQRYIEDAVKNFGRVDVLVNNAGVAPSSRDDLLEAKPESYDRVMEINLRGPYFLTQAFANKLIEQGDGGTIINVSSISAETVSLNRGEYCISKAGVAMATKLWAARLAPEGILVYEIRPGVIATDMTSGVTEKYDKLLADGLAPMPRWGQPDDIGGAVVQLAAQQMPYSTGDVIHVDGGMHIARL